MGRPFFLEAIHENCIYTSDGDFSLDASGDKVGWIVRAPEAITVDRIALCYNGKTGTPPTYRYSLQGISSTGNPSGTVLGATNNALATLAPTAISNDSFHELTLSESVAFSAGEKFSIVAEYSSGTVNGSNFASYRYGYPNLANNYDFGDAFGYSLTNTASWTKQIAYLPVVLFGDGTNWYGNPFTGARTARNFSTSSSPSEYGLKFIAPAIGSLATYKIRGLRLGLLMSVASNSQTIGLNLYEGGGASDTTQTKTTSIDTDCFMASTSFSPKDLIFDGTAPTLTAGNTYRISMTASSVNGHSIYTLPLTSATHVSALGWGSTFCRTDRAGGNWTDTDTQVPLVFGMYLEDLAGSGGTTSYHFARSRGATFGKGRW